LEKSFSRGKEQLKADLKEKPEKKKKKIKNKKKKK
jgi:hypothetical protein